MRAVFLDQFALHPLLRREDTTNLGRRSRHTDAFFVGIDIRSRPDRNLCAVRFHGSLDGREARFGNRFDDRYHGGQLGFHDFIAILMLAVHFERVASDFDFRRIGDLRNPQVLGNAGSHLGSVAVNCLLAAENQIHRSHFFDRRGQRIGRRQSIRAAKSSVADQHRFVRTHGQTFFQGVGSLRGPHRNNAHLAPMLFFQLQGNLHRNLVKRIDNAGHAFADERVLDRVDLNFRCVRHLLDTDHDFH